MKEQIAAQQLIRKKFLEIQERNQQFSVRAFAIKMGLQPSATNEILKGERRISKKMAEKIAEKLLLNPSERADFLGLFPSKKVLPKSVEGSEALGSMALKLSADQFSTIADPLHFAILGLIRTKFYKTRTFESVDEELSWIAERLEKKKNDIKKSIDRLERLSLVKRDAKSGHQYLTRTQERVHTEDDVLNLSIQKAHIATLDQARSALVNVPVELRDFSTLIFPVDPMLLPQAKEILRKTQDELAALLGTNDAQEVYQLSCYLYPVTKIKKVEKRK